MSRTGNPRSIKIRLGLADVRPRISCGRGNGTFQDSDSSKHFLLPLDDGLVVVLPRTGPNTEGLLLDSIRPQVRETQDQRAVASSGPRRRPHIDANMGPGYTNVVVGSGREEVDEDRGDEGRELREMQHDRAKCWWRVVDPETCKEGTDISACCKSVRRRRHDLHQHKSYVVLTSIGRAHELRNRSVSRRQSRARPTLEVLGQVQRR